MLVDILSPANYIMINRDAIRILGLNTAVYCSELLTIYKKVVKKKVFYANNFFKVDREYIQRQTSLTIDEQLKCDLNLKKVNIVKIDSENPDLIFFDVEIFASVLASEDIKLLDGVSKKVKIDNPKGSKEEMRKRIIQSLKDSIRCKTYEVLLSLKDWIDSVMANPNKYLSVQQVQLFKDRLDDYCNGDLNVALSIIKEAIVHQYIDCQWAINSYEKSNATKLSIQNLKNSNVSVTQKKSDASSLSEEVF